jgi:hypothetical protein
MAFIHMSSIFLSKKTNKILSIIQEQGQYYLYDIKKRLRVILKYMLLKNEKQNISYIEKQINDINIKMNKKIIGIYTEIENLKQVIYDIQRKIYGYSIPSVCRVGNISNDSSWC